MTERLSCRRGVCGVCVECRRLLKEEATVVDLDVALDDLARFADQVEEKTGSRPHTVVAPRLHPLAQAILDEPRPKAIKRRVRPVQNRRKQE